MKKELVTKQLTTALTALGINGKIRVKAVTKRGDETRVEVYVNDNYSGIFDLDKNTFVD